MNNGNFEGLSDKFDCGLLQALKTANLREVKALESRVCRD